MLWLGFSKKFHLQFRVLLVVQISKYSPILTENIKTYQRNSHQLQFNGLRYQLFS